MSETHGRQFTKLMKAAGEVVRKGARGKGETGGQVKLGLPVEGQEKQQKGGLEKGQAAW
jgi:hypothetical protein